jgi:hypothetical protein
MEADEIIGHIWIVGESVKRDLVALRLTREPDRKVA